VGKSAATALESLESARGVMASSINVLRADIKDLEKISRNWPGDITSFENDSTQVLFLDPTSSSAMKFGRMR
jgi:hypothetical protein